MEEKRLIDANSIVSVAEHVSHAQDDLDSFYKEQEG